MKIVRGAQDVARFLERVFDLACSEQCGCSGILPPTVRTAARRLQSFETLRESRTRCQGERV